MSRKIRLNQTNLSLVNSVGKALSYSKDFYYSIKEVLKLLYSYLDINISFIALKEHIEDKHIKIVEAFGINTKEAKKINFSLGEGITGKILKSGVPFVVDDIKTNPSYLNKTGILDMIKDESLIGVPIKIGSETIGVLCVFKALREENINSLIDTFISIATMIGMSYKLFLLLREEKIAWEEEKSAIQESFNKNFSLEGLIGISRPFLNLIDSVKKISISDSTVLLIGESGTGKNLIARTIHSLSQRKNAPFIYVNCASIPDTLIEAELFGYEKGAFTGAFSSKKGKFELANKGTIFLDEIGDLNLSVQGKLLNVIQEKTLEKLGSERVINLDVRIIAATNKNLEKLIKEGKFREDLYYRLNVIQLYVPALRERKEDIPYLIDYFLESFNKKYNKRVKFSKETIEKMSLYNWPGNIRELENVIERLVIMNEKNKVINVKDLPSFIINNVPQNLENLSQFIEKTEKENIISALEKTGYVKSRAAKMLGLTLRQLDYRIKKYNIDIQKVL